MLENIKYMDVIKLRLSILTITLYQPPFFSKKKKFDYFERIKINQFERISRTRQNYNKVRAYLKNKK